MKDLLESGTLYFYYVLYVFYPYPMLRSEIHIHKEFPLCANYLPLLYLFSIFSFHWTGHSIYWSIARRQYSVHPHDV